MIPIDLSGKSAIVTGSGQGLGKATATLLHRAGASVVINYFEDSQGVNRKRAEETVAELGGRAVAVAADVRKEDEVRQMVATAVERFGRLDILVNNAGILRDRTLKKMSMAEWQAVIDTNLTGVFSTTHLALEKMSDGGRIVNLSSIAAFVGFFGQSNYAAAKAGVSAMTKVWARELGKRRITVNAIAPGVALTEMGLTIPEESRAQMLTNIPLGRFAEPEEMASVILFLCSNLASYVSGQTIHVNGGWWAS